MEFAYIAFSSDFLPDCESEFKLPLLGSRKLMSPFKNLILKIFRKKISFSKHPKCNTYSHTQSLLDRVKYTSNSETHHICKPKNRNPDTTVPSHYCYKLETTVLLNFLNMPTSKPALVISWRNSRFCNRTLSREVPGHLCYCSPLGQSSASDSLSGKS